MSTLVLLEVTAKPECVNDVKEFFRTHLPDTRRYEGCQGITVYEHEDGRVFVQVQHWDSKEHYQKYLAWRVESSVSSAFLSRRLSQAGLGASLQKRRNRSNLCNNVRWICRLIFHQIKTWLYCQL